MDTGRFNHPGAEVRFSFLRDRDDAWLEFYHSITPDRGGPLDRQVAVMEEAETALLRSLDVPEETAVFKRIFSSDLMSHRESLERYKERRSSDFFFSMIEQPPAAGAKLALLGLSIAGAARKSREGNIFRFHSTPEIGHICVEKIMDPAAGVDSGAEEQTARIFEQLAERLARYGAAVKESVLRTWIYTPHVDADYPGIVKARTRFYDAIGLNRETHYIASTGIQGGTGERFARVSMDAYAVTGVGPEKVRHIQAPGHMCPTHAYGVTFERATAITMGETDFLFISGTASIDRDGEIVHPGDVARQAERTLENIGALLDAAGFARSDLSSFIVYLRDPSDHDIVQPVLDAFAPDLPMVAVKAPVCRPGWLIEIEATAAKVPGLHSYTFFEG